MSEFEFHCLYALLRKRKFFNDKKPQDYHKFLVVNSEIIPDNYLYKKGADCWIWMSSKIVKEININFEAGQSYRFIMNLEGQKSAKFLIKDIDNRNAMVLKTQEYFKNTVKKIGQRENDKYLYEDEKFSWPTKNKKNIRPETKNSSQIWKRIAIIVSPVLLLFLFLFLFVKWINKDKKI